MNESKSSKSLKNQFQIEDYLQKTVKTQIDDNDNTKHNNSLDLVKSPFNPKSPLKKRRENQN
jgi:U3 small nucleolar ribonucleoprotein component